MCSTCICTNKFSECLVSGSVLYRWFDVFVYVYSREVGACTLVCLWSPGNNFGCHFSEVSCICFILLLRLLVGWFELRLGLLLVWNVPNRLGCLDTKPQGSAAFKVGITSARYYTLIFLCGFGGNLTWVLELAGQVLCWQNHLPRTLFSYAQITQASGMSTRGKSQAKGDTRYPGATD